MQPPENQNEPGRLSWLAKIYRAYASGLQRYVLSKVGDPFLAEDITSIVFLKALRWLRADQSVESVRGWLYATARTTIADHWQALGQYETHLLSDVEEQSVPPLEGVELARQQAQLRVQRLLDLLPEREREVLSLRYLQGYSAAEIARALGINAGYVRVLQLRALRRAAQVETQERKVYAMQEQGMSFESAIQLLTPQSTRVLDLSYEEAQRLKHNFIGTEHLLWGLASEGSLASFFTPLDITAERIHAGIVFIYDRYAQGSQHQFPTQDQSIEGKQPSQVLTPRAKQVVALASDEMKRQEEQQIRPAHLLLGMYQEGAGIGIGLLRSLGVSQLQVRAALAPPDATQACAFCGKTGSQVKRLFPSMSLGEDPTPHALICDGCVERFHGMMGEP